MFDAPVNTGKRSVELQKDKTDAIIPQAVELGEVL